MVGVGKGKEAWKRSRKRRSQSKDKSSSDDSDMDYMVEEDASEDSNESEDYCSSINGDELEEHLGGFEVEKEWEKGKKVLISKSKRSSSNRRKVGGKFSRNRRRVSYNEVNDDGDCEFDEEDDNDEEFRPDEVDSIDEKEYRPVKRRRVSFKEEDEEFKPDGVDEEEEESTVKRQRVSVKKEDEEFRPNGVDDEEEDEEFRPDGVDGVDEEEEESTVKRQIISVKEEDEEFRPDGVDDEEEESTVKRRRVSVKEEDEEFRPDGVDDEEEDEEFRPDGVDDEEEDEEFRPDGVDDEEEDEEFRPDGVDDEEEESIVKRRRVSVKEEDEEFRPDGVDDEEEVSTVKRRRVSVKEEDEEFRPDGVDDEEEESTVKRQRVSRKEVEDDYEEDYDFNDDEEEDYDFDDEEFTPEEVNSLDEEEDTRVKKKASKQLGRRVLRRKSSVKIQKRKRKPKVLKKCSRKKATRKPSLRRKVKNCDYGGFSPKRGPIMIEESNKRPGSRNKRLIVQSDSDFVNSGPSDCNFTISEEEREQVREAGKLCKTLTATSRSYSSKKIEETIDLKQPRKPPVRKGKEKVEDVKNEVVKRVCGICLSEEGKRSVRGTLNCCSHYFCFGCIMEWSKVESRCPLCKQRFITISKPGKSNTGIDPRDVVTQVPERDQIYQPSEEEIRGYLDPYEHVMCTECQQGGDDNLMLLCDLCDSPSHTYCVGLGQEVPEGNWYCEGCRPVALASLMSQSQYPLPSQAPIDINMSHRSSPSENMEHGLDPSTLPSPFSRGGMGGLSPRYSFRDAFASPRSGAGVSTLSGRRDIHRRIRSFFNNIRTRQVIGRSDTNLVPNVGSDHPEFQVEHDIETTTYQLPRTTVAGTSYFNFLGNPSTVQNGVFSPARSNNFTRQVTQEPFSTTSNLENGELQTGSDLISNHEQHNHHSSGSIMDSDRAVSFSAKGQVQSMVESYLKSIISNLGLGHDSFTDISRKSTHTVLAACGLEHQTSEVYSSLQQQPSLECSHDAERMTDQRTSPVNGCCLSCFESFVRTVVKTILNERLPPFLWVRD